MPCECTETLWCMNVERKWSRFRSQRPGDTCADSSLFCHRLGDHQVPALPCLPRGASGSGARRGGGSRSPMGTIIRFVLVAAVAMALFAKILVPRAPTRFNRD